MESLEERTNKVKDKEHLLLRLNQRHQPVSHQIKQAADLEIINCHFKHFKFVSLYLCCSGNVNLSKSRVVPGGVSSGEQVGELTICFQAVHRLEVKHL